jgi:WD repeat and SOF domain-containing protein 1
VKKNVDPALHPFEREREYVRALNAVKLDKMFAKPFIGALTPSHYDGVTCMARHPTSLSALASGDASGEVRTWSASARTCTGHVQAHAGRTTGASFSAPTRLLTCGDDRCVKEWVFPFGGSGDEEAAATVTPVATFHAAHSFTAVDAQYGSATTFASGGGSVVELWDRTRGVPVRTFGWGTETVLCVRWNLVETDLLASSAADRSVALYDVRQPVPLHKVVLVARANSLAWNPIEAYNFTVALDDGGVLTFDMRRLGAARAVHEGHVGAVLDVDYAPTGREFVTGSFDHTVRLW